MTAAITFAQGRKGYLFADMAYTCTATGEVRYIDSKFVVGNGKVPWAVVTTGNLNPHALARKFEGREIRNANALLSAWPGIMHDLENDAERDGEPAIKFGVYGIVWSSRLSRPCPFLAFNHEYQGLKPYEALLVDWATAGTAPLCDLLGREADPRAPASFDPKGDGLALMEALRRTTTDGKHNIVGGGIQCLTLTRDGAEIETLRMWPDRIGARIDQLNRSN